VGILSHPAALPTTAVLLLKANPDPEPASSKAGEQESTSSQVLEINPVPSESSKLKPSASHATEFQSAPHQVHQVTLLAFICDHTQKTCHREASPPAIPPASVSRADHDDGCSDCSAGQAAGILLNPFVSLLITSGLWVRSEMPGLTICDQFTENSD
jgi:hypothetical protein